MITHTIYHVPGKKVGCTRDLTKRRLWYPKGTILEVLEQLHDKTDLEAGDIEWAWAVKFGYKRHQHFARSPAVTQTPEERQQLAQVRGKKGGLRSVETNPTGGFRGFTTEQKAAAGEKGARRLLELGLNGFQTMTSEEHSKNGKKGGLRSVETNPTGGFRGFTTEQKAAAGRRTKELGVGIHGFSLEWRSSKGKELAALKAICPYCGLEGSLGNLKRWHFDKCPKKTPEA